MVGWDDFLVGVLGDLTGAALVAITVYFLFRRREKKDQERLVESVVMRLNRAFNSFIAEVVYSSQSDIFEPLGFVSLLLDIPVSSLVGDMARFQEELTAKIKDRNIKDMLQLRKKQWSLILSKDFLLSMQQVVGQWSRKQWTKYYVFLDTLRKQIRDLMDMYQSRLPPDIVRKIMDFELETESFGFPIEAFPEFFCRIDELEIELRRELLPARRTSQAIACEKWHSICNLMTKLQDELTVGAPFRTSRI